jgi:hypothetical protein
MATKKTTTKTAEPKAKATTKTAAKKAPKGEAKATGPRHPAGRVTQLHKGKEELAKALAPALAFGEETADAVAARLKTASNTQLLRLHKVVETVKGKWGSREKLIAAILDAGKKAKDKDFVAKLNTFTLPRLVDLARR